MSPDAPGPSPHDFPEMTKEETVEVLVDLQARSESFNKEASSAVRQFALAGFAILWLLHKDTAAGFEFTPDMKWPAFLFLGALACDFLYWSLGALVWSLDRRILLGDTKSWGSRSAQRALFRIEHVRGADAVRVRPTLYLMIAEIALIVLGYASLALSVNHRVFFG